MSAHVLPVQRLADQWVRCVFIGDGLKIPGHKRYRNGGGFAKRSYYSGQYKRRRFNNYRRQNKWRSGRRQTQGAYRKRGVYGSAVRRLDQARQSRDLQSRATQNYTREAGRRGRRLQSLLERPSVRNQAYRRGGYGFGRKLDTVLSAARVFDTFAPGYYDAAAAGAGRALSKAGNWLWDTASNAGSALGYGAAGLYGAAIANE